MRQYLAPLVAALLFSTTAHAQQNCATPAALNDGWSIAVPEDVGIARGALCALDVFISHLPQPNVHAVIVTRHGKLVAERYYTGADQNFAQPLGSVAFGPAVKHDLRAMTEPVVSLLVGIAAGEGKFPALDQPVLDFFPQYAALRTSEKTAVTWRQLLTMTTALGWSEQMAYEDPANSANLLNAAADPAKFILEQPMCRPAAISSTAAAAPRCSWRRWPRAPACRSTSTRGRSSSRRSASRISTGTRCRAAGTSRPGASACPRATLPSSASPC